MLALCHLSASRQVAAAVSTDLFLSGRPCARVSAKGRSIPVSEALRDAASPAAVSRPGLPITWKARPGWAVLWPTPASLQRPVITKRAHWLRLDHPHLHVLRALVALPGGPGREPLQGVLMIR